MAQGSIFRKLIAASRTHRNASISGSAPETPPRLRHLAQRYAACRLLEKKGIPNVVWFEDVLALYGSDAAVFDLHILVPDKFAAAAALLKSGYSNALVAGKSSNDRHLFRGGIRVEASRGSSRTGTVLIDASEWDYDLRHRAVCDLAPLPPLDKFLEALMCYWLSIPDAGYKEGNFVWAMSVATLISYAYDLPSPTRNLLRRPGFAAHLRPEIHELHYDLIGEYPRKSGISSLRKHQYHALRYRQIRAGRFSPQPYPTDGFPVSLAEYPELTGVGGNGAGHMRPRKGARKRQRLSVSFVGVPSNYRILANKTS